MKCENCNSEHHGKYGSGRFCKVECSRSYSTRNDTNEELKKSICVNCKKEIYIKKRSPHTVKCDECKNKKVERIKQPKKCLECSNLFFGNKFCSSSCATMYNKKKKWLDIEKNNGIGNYGIRTIKNYLIYKRGHQCEICKATKWMGQNIPLVLDHINGRAKDNRLENLQLVCGNCDMQLPTYKSKNKNSDRQRVGKYK